jgi:hypothetical protein
MATIGLSSYLSWLLESQHPRRSPFGTFGTVRPARSPERPDDLGGDPSASSAGTAAPGDPTGLGGRLALNEDLNVNPISVSKTTIGLMGQLAGPIGSLVSSVALGIP